MNPRTTVPVLALLALLALPSNLMAQTGALEGTRVAPEGQPVRTRFETDFARRHDRGLLFHADVGLAFGSAGGDMGLGPAAKLGLGWLPWEQVGLSLDVWGAVCASNMLGVVGPGLRYFFTDSAINMGGRLGPGLLRDPDATQQTLLGAQMDVSWQPYVSRDWSLGLGLDVGVHGLDLDGDSSSPSGWLVGLRIGLTMN
jgi:hypothetical protein